MKWNVFVLFTGWFFLSEVEVVISYRVLGLTVFLVFILSFLSPDSDRKVTGGCGVSAGSVPGPVRSGTMTGK